MSIGNPRHRGRLATALLAAAAVGASLFTAIPASAQTATVTDAVFDWGINNESNGGAYFGGCNFLSAGVAGNTGAARTWTAADGFFKSTDGNTTIVKPSADGTSLVQPTWATKCQTPEGATVTGKATNAANSYTQSRVQISNGTGTVDPVANTAEITWNGSFSVVYYGGMTYWSVSNPVLTVEADGTGTLTGTASGYGADMDDPSIWEAIPATTITLAELTGVDVTSTGVSITPDYLGVSVPADINGRNPQAAIDAENTPWWGAFPGDYLAFQELTGQSSYWYTTSGGPNSIQPRKVPSPITIGYSEIPAAALVVETQPVAVEGALGSTVTLTGAASGGTAPIGYQWQKSVNGTDWANVAGATGTSLTVTANAAGAASYRFVATDAAAASVTSSAAAVTVAVPTPTVVVSKTSGLNPDGETITVSGTNFLPNPGLTQGIRPPLANKFTGAYIAFGTYLDVWKPTENAPATARKNSDQLKWGVNAADMGTIGGAGAGAIEIAADGSWSTTLSVKHDFAGKIADGNFGIYTYPGGGAKYAPFETYTPITFQTTVDRVSGANRYDVAVEIANTSYPNGADVVYIATGEKFPDALSAAPAAASQNGPLLLTAGAALPANVKSTIQALAPEKIVVVGGVNSVSAAVYNELDALTDEIVRIGGADRYEASRNLVDYAFGDSGATAAFISTGANFPDALSAGAVGGFSGAPVLMVNGSQPALDAPTKGLLADLGVEDVTIAGGPNSVSTGIEAELATLATTVTRAAGADRFEASVSINRTGVTSSDTVFLATGFNFPDALAGAAWAGKIGAPLYVVPGNCVPRAVLDDIKNLNAINVTLLGGPNSLNASVESLTVCS